MSRHTCNPEVGEQDIPINELSTVKLCWTFKLLPYRLTCQRHLLSIQSRTDDIAETEQIARQNTEQISSD